MLVAHKFLIFNLLSTISKLFPNDDHQKGWRRS